MRRVALVVAFGLVLMACTTGTDEATTTATVAAEEPSITTSTPVVEATATTVAVTTTTATDRVVPLTPSEPFAPPFSLLRGVTYRHDLLVPFELGFSEPGWSVVWVGEVGLLLSHRTGERPVAVGVTVQRSDSVEQLVESLRADEKTSDWTEPSSVSVGGASGVVFDLLVDGVVEEPAVVSPDLPGCVGPFLAEEGFWGQDLVGCAWNRVWVVDARGIVVVIHAAVDTRDPEVRQTLAGIEPLIDEFLAAITFER